ncbi:hypothetical protein EDD38_5546 [Kitasatospora cineracea]|uniref:Uncharacterized protein n=1 Tax=Kitasatospora cineracea TaxID=88074 RepID=A0A3N4S1Q7_9ACTN|nr:hypothetical protein EDD38_5546 [Kitasatospora cineracea]
MPRRADRSLGDRPAGRSPASARPGGGTREVRAAVMAPRRAPQRRFSPAPPLSTGPPAADQPARTPTRNPLEPGGPRPFSDAGGYPWGLRTRPCCPGEFTADGVTTASAARLSGDSTGSWRNLLASDGTVACYDRVSGCQGAVSGICRVGGARPIAWRGRRHGPGVRVDVGRQGRSLPDGMTMSVRFDCSDPVQRAEGLREAAAAVRRGELVVLPTDTSLRNRSGGSSNRSTAPSCSTGASPATTTTAPTTPPPSSNGPPPPACSAASPPQASPGATRWSWPRERHRTPAAAAGRTRRERRTRRPPAMWSPAR